MDQAKCLVSSPGALTNEQTDDSNLHYAFFCFK